jgi:hypothetical protein
MPNDVNTQQEQTYDFMRDYEELKRLRLLGPQTKQKTAKMSSDDKRWYLAIWALLAGWAVVLALLAGLS